MPKPKERV